VTARGSTDDGRMLAVSGGWAVTSDGLQWVLRRRAGADRRTGKPVWKSVSFVHSTRDILARCMREKGCPATDATRLLAALGERFLPVAGTTPQADDQSALAQAADSGSPAHQSEAAAP
jgi:hypothetical protein